MPAVKPRLPDKTRTFKQEVQIADRDSFIKKEPGYVFNDGKRKFDDKVSKSGYS